MEPRKKRACIALAQLLPLQQWETGELWGDDGPAPARPSSLPFLRGWLMALVRTLHTCLQCIVMRALLSASGLVLVASWTAGYMCPCRVALLGQGKLQRISRIQWVITSILFVFPAFLYLYGYTPIPIRYCILLYSYVAASPSRYPLLYSILCPVRMSYIRSIMYSVCTPIWWG